MQTEKEQLITDIMNIIMGNVVDYKAELRWLLNDALHKKTIKELQEMEKTL